MTIDSNTMLQKLAVKLAISSKEARKDHWNLKLMQKMDIF